MANMPDRCRSKQLEIYALQTARRCASSALTSTAFWSFFTGLACLLAVTWRRRALLAFVWNGIFRGHQGLSISFKFWLFTWWCMWTYSNSFSTTFLQLLLMNSQTNNLPWWLINPDYPSNPINHPLGLSNIFFSRNDKTSWSFSGAKSGTALWLCQVRRSLLRRQQDQAPLLEE